MTEHLDLRRDGKRSHYVVEGECRNCGWTGYLWVTRGYLKPAVGFAKSAWCERCGCKEIVGGKYVEA